MLAYHGRESVKREYVETALEHERADAYVKGVYWQEQERRGCNIGCWTKAETGAHDALSSEMGVPVELLHVSDGLFEALPDPHYKTWSRRFATSIPVGADLGGAWARVLEWIVSDGQYGLIVLAENLQTKAALRLLGSYYRGVGRWEVPPIPRELDLAMTQLRGRLSAWHDWNEAAMRDMRAIRAAQEAFRTLPADPKGLSRAAWAARAAWSAWEAYTLAQSEALLDILMSAPTLSPRRQHALA